MIMEKKRFVRALGMLMLVVLASLRLSAQPRAIISDHLEPAVLINPGDTITAKDLNDLNDKGRDALKSRGFVYVKNGGSIYVDMRRLSQFNRWEYQEDSPIVKINPVLDPRGSTRKTLHYIDKSGNEQELQLEVIPYNVPMLHSQGALYELDPRTLLSPPTFLRDLKMAREQINAFYEYRITDDRQLDDYITVQDPAQGQTGIDKPEMTIDYRMPTPEAPYDMREFGVLGGGYDFDKGVSIAQLRAISQRYPHTEASDLDPNAHGIDSLDFTVCIASGSIAWSSSRHFSYASGGGRYYTYIRVIDERRRRYSLSNKIAVFDSHSAGAGKPYTPEVTDPGKVRVLIDGKSLDEARPLYGRLAKVKVDVIEDPDELYTIHSVVTNKGRVVYQLGKTQIGDASPNKSFRSLELDYRVGADEEFIVTLTQARKLVTVQSSDASLGEVAVATNSWESSFDAVKGSQRAISPDGMTLYVKPKANASFVGWKIEGVDTLFTQKTDVLTNNYVDTYSSRLYSDVLSDGTLRATIFVRRSLNLTAVFERKAPAKATLTVQYPPDRPEVGKVLIDGEERNTITVDVGTKVHLKGVSTNPDYYCAYWSSHAQNALLSYSEEIDFEVKGDDVLVAVFDPYRQISPIRPDEVGGTISPEVVKIKQEDFEREFKTKRLTFTAKAKEGYTFKGWVEDDHIISSEPRLERTIEGWYHKSCLPLFEQVGSNEEPEKPSPTPTPLAPIQELKARVGQRDAVLTWAAGEAKQWRVLVYNQKNTDTPMKDVITQTPRLELDALEPGTEYVFTVLVADGAPVDEEKITWHPLRTERFDEAEAITPYLKNFSSLKVGQPFELIWMDINPAEFASSKPIYQYYWQATSTSELVPLTPKGKQLTLESNRQGGRLIVRILSGEDKLYEIGYNLNE